jgi:hypothetical protein
VSKSTGFWSRTRTSSAIVMQPHTTSRKCTAQQTSSLHVQRGRLAAQLGAGADERPEALAAERQRR